MTSDDRYLYRRAVPELGVEVFVAPMLFNDRIMLGIPTEVGYRVDDYWCYRPGTAVSAAEAWDPTVDNEPVGWIKHGSSGRYSDDGTVRTETGSERTR